MLYYVVGRDGSVHVMLAGKDHSAAKMSTNACHNRARMAAPVMMA